MPLVTSAALTHSLFGDFQLEVTAPILVGSVLGYAWARLSSRASDRVIRPLLAITWPAPLPMAGHSADLASDWGALFIAF